MTKRHPDVEHPCLTCALPDCDDKSPACPLRQILSQERGMRTRGEKVSPRLSRLRSIAYREIYYWDRRIRQHDQRQAGDSC